MDVSVTVRWLGVAGIELRVGGRVLLIDPFVSRPPFRRMWFGRIEPDRMLIAARIPRCDAILVTHAHWDHLMDVPEVAQRDSPAVYGSPNTCALLGSLGVPQERLHVLADGDHFGLGRVDVAVDVLSAVHTKILGRQILRGPVRADLHPPLRLRDYRMDDDFSFLLCAAGYRLLDWSSARVEGAVAADVLFVKPFAARMYFDDLLSAVRPQLVIPIHWDDLYRPLSKPLRPTLGPPTWSLPPLRRVDLHAFRRRVHQVAPNTRMLVPDLCTSYDLGHLL